MKKWSRRLGFVMMVAGLIVVMGSGVGWAKNPKNVVFVIGDSLSDPGNLYALTGSWPLSPPYAQRNSNGPVWTEYFSAEMGVKVDSRAFGGAFSGTFLLDGIPVSNGFSVQNPPAIPNLPGVSEEIDGLLAEFPNGLNPFALYVIWAGSNDFFLGMAQPGMLEEILAQTLENLSDSVCRLGTAGARHFVVGNIPDIGLTPFAQEFGSEAQTLFSHTISQFNMALEQALANLPEACAETMVVLDTYQILREVSADPAAFGLSNVTDACLTFDDNMLPEVCTNPDEYLYWDSVHPTTAGQAIFADKFRATFCRTGEKHPGLRGRPSGKPPAAWRGVCYGTK